MPNKYMQHKCDQLNKPDGFQRSRKSFKAISDHKALSREVHGLVDRIDEIEKRLWVMSDVMAVHDIAVCDFCGWEWFTVKPVQGYGTRGDVRGLLVDGIACCTKCLNALYATIPSHDEEEEVEAIYHDVAWWAARVGQGVLAGTDFADNPEIKKHWKRLP